MHLRLKQQRIKIIHAVNAQQVCFHTETSINVKRCNVHLVLMAMLVLETLNKIAHHVDMDITQVAMKRNAINVKRDIFQVLVLHLAVHVNVR